MVTQHDTPSFLPPIKPQHNQTNSQHIQSQNMASKATTTIALLLSLNLLFFFFTSVSGCNTACPRNFNLVELNLCLLRNGPFLANRNCCPLVQGLVDADAAVCLCSVLRALNVPLRINLKALVNRCVPTYSCDDPCPQF